MNEAETRAELIDPRPKDAGWGLVDDSRILREHRISAEFQVILAFCRFLLYSTISGERRRVRYTPPGRVRRIRPPSGCTDEPTYFT